MHLKPFLTNTIHHWNDVACGEHEQIESMKLSLLFKKRSRKGQKHVPDKILRNQRSQQATVRKYVFIQNQGIHVLFNVVVHG